VDTFQWLAAAGHKEEWRKQAKQIIEEEEMKECTFRPQLAVPDPNRSVLSSQ